MRPREACANWLICAALNEASGTSLMFGSDPTGGDGVIFDGNTGYAVALTEHVIAGPIGDADVNVNTLILRAVEEKRALGESYAAGKTLVVYVAAKGEWRDNIVAQLPNPLFFADVYVVSREELRLASMSMASPSSMSPRATPQAGACASQRISPLGQ